MTTTLPHTLQNIQLGLAVDSASSTQYGKPLPDDRLILLGVKLSEGVLEDHGKLPGSETEKHKVKWRRMVRKR